MASATPVISIAPSKVEGVDAKREPNLVLAHQRLIPVMCNAKSLGKILDTLNDEQKLEFIKTSLELGRIFFWHTEDPRLLDRGNRIADLGYKYWENESVARFYIERNLSAQMVSGRGFKPRIVSETGEWQGSGSVLEEDDEMPRGALLPATQLVARNSLSVALTPLLINIPLRDRMASVAVFYPMLPLVRLGFLNMEALPLLLVAATRSVLVDRTSLRVPSFERHEQVVASRSAGGVSNSHVFATVKVPFISFLSNTALPFPRRILTSSLENLVLPATAAGLDKREDIEAPAVKEEQSLEQVVEYFVEKFKPGAPAIDRDAGDLVSAAVPFNVRANRRLIGSLGGRNRPAHIRVVPNTLRAPRLRLRRMFLKNRLGRKIFIRYSWQKMFRKRIILLSPPPRLERGFKV